MAERNGRVLNSAKLAQMGRALRSRNYRLFFMGQGVSLIGTWMQRMALLWLVAEMYPDERQAAFWLGLVGFAGQIPAFIVTPLAGVLADRWDRRRMVLVTQTLAMLQAFALAALALTGVIDIWHVLLLSAAMGAIAGMDVPTRQSFVIEMVDRPEDLNNAIALNSSVVNAGRLIGPAVGGLLVAFAGPGLCFLINALTFLAVIAALAAMRVPPRKVAPSDKHVLAHLAEGFNYAFRFPPIRSMLLLMTLTSLVAIPYGSQLPVFAKHVLASGPRTYGVLMAAVAVGAMGGGFYLAARTTVRGLGRVIALAPAILGVGLVAFSMSRSLWLSLLLAPALGVGQMLLMAAGNTVLQTIVDDDKRGRVMSFYAMSFMGMVPLGNLLIGTVASQVGAPLAVGCGGALCAVGAVVFALQLPMLRKLVRPIYERKGIIPSVADGLAAAAEQQSALPKTGRE